MRVIIGLLLLAAIYPLRADDTAPVDTSRLLRHVSVLSADSMGGRRAGTAYEAKAARYIASAMSEIGLHPAGADTSYFQNFPLKRACVYSTSAVYVGDDTLTFPENFHVYRVPPGQHRVSEKIIFAGYGIHNPGDNLDSYRDLDVTGHTVVVLAPSLWGREHAKLAGKVDAKQLADWARDLKAAGIIIIYDTVSGKPNRSGSDRRLAAELFDPIDTTGFLWVAVTGGRDFLVRNFGIHELSSIRFDSHAEADRDVISSMDIEPLFGSNVIGVIAGTGLRNEAVVLSAHYDHLGADSHNRADSVFNGVLDNASGVAALLEVARSLTAKPERPRRSIVFVATSGEELGLVGSRYFVAHPPAGMQIVANVNLDVAGFAFKNDKPWCTLFGAEYSDMGEVFEAACKASGISLASNYLPSFFFRSDCRAFAEAGVPSIFPASGMARRDMGEGMEYFEGFYHQPTDELGKTPISFRVLEKHSAMVASALWSLANQNATPRWTRSLDSESWLKVRDMWGQIRIWFARYVF